MAIPHTRVLLTGATGFLGAYLLRRLVQAGYSVRALRRQSSPMELVGEWADKVEWADADVTDLVALEDVFRDVSHVCHCAAIVSFHPRDEARMMRINAEGTANLVNLSLEYGVKKFIHASSIAALGRTPERLDLNENTPWVNSKGNSSYAISKYLAEQEVWRGHAEGLPVAIVNPGLIIGSGFWHLGSAKMYSQLHKGLRFAPTGRTGMVDVRDVAAFMHHLLESDITGERYVLVSENVVYGEYFKMIAREIGARSPSLTVKPWMAEVAWRVEWLKEKLTGAEPLVTRATARSSVSQYRYENDKSLSVFGFRYRPVAQTVRETAAVFREAAQNGFPARMLEE